MTIFGNIMLGSDVEQAVIDTLSLWMSTYLAEVERQKGLPAGSLPNILTYTVKSDFETWPEDQLPTCVVVSPGLSGTPVKDGEGNYSAGWLVSIAIVVSASTQEFTKRNAKIYAGAVRALLVQQSSLNGVARGLTWDDESYDDLPPEDMRSLGAGILAFTVTFDNILLEWGGPLIPPVDPNAPPGNWPTVAPGKVTVTLNKETL